MSALAVLAASVLAACTSNSTSSAPPTGNSSGPILIGASLSLSAGTAANPDTFQADGLAFRRGYELWASDVNKNGGLHSGVTLRSVQGLVRFDALGENGAAAAFVFQWQQGQFVQVLPSATDGPPVIDKTPWIGAGTKGPAA
jgi:hypothetical protein